MIEEKVEECNINVGKKMRHVTLQKKINKLNSTNNLLECNTLTKKQRVSSLLKLISDVSPPFKTNLSDKREIICWTIS